MVNPPAAPAEVPARQHKRATSFPASFNIHDPDVNFGVAGGGLGVPGLRVTQPDEITVGIKEMLLHDRRLLLDLVLEDG
jgi:thiamine pyrophosphate-dependent acetolactate synthase large subunit-like protein